MSAPPSLPKILLIDSNVLFSKRVSDALAQEGFEVVPCNESAYALTMLEWNMPAAILCATNLREMGALELPRILRADLKTAHIPIIAVGDGGEQALMEAFRSGCDEYVERRLGAQNIAAHVKSFLRSRQEGSQLPSAPGSAESALTGSLACLNLSGVIQMLCHSRQTGALYISGSETHGVIYFEAGEVTHAEAGSLFGDEAVMEIVKKCEGAGVGAYKFVYSAVAATRTVLRSATDLMLDAMRELDESRHGPKEGSSQ